MSEMTNISYSGLQRTLVVAFDVGLRSSAVSYAILVPGDIPQVRAVTQCVEAHDLYVGVYPDQLFQGFQDSNLVAALWFRA